jgi:hypothetical protein
MKSFFLMQKVFLPASELVQPGGPFIEAAGSDEDSKLFLELLESSQLTFCFAFVDCFRDDLLKIRVENRWKLQEFRTTHRQPLGIS